MQIFVAWLFGARFDLLLNDLKPSNWKIHNTPVVIANVSTTATVHKEL